MTPDQTNALLKEYSDLIKDLQTENADLTDKVQMLENYIQELEFQFKTSHDKSYDC